MSVVSPAAKKRELRELDAAIAERKKYYAEQETLINELVESGNTQLMGLTHDIQIAQQELRTLKVEVRTGRKDKQLLEQDLDTVRSEIGNLAPSFGMPSPAMG